MAKAIRKSSRLTNSDTRPRASGLRLKDVKRVGGTVILEGPSAAGRQRDASKTPPDAPRG